MRYLTVRIARFLPRDEGLPGPIERFHPGSLRRATSRFVGANRNAPQHQDMSHPCNRHCSSYATHRSLASRWLKI